MAKPTEVKAGDACPQCGGTFVLDPSQNPDTLIDRVKRNAQNDQAAARYADATRAKAEDHGLIHMCSVCGYRSRFHPAAAAATEDTTKATNAAKGKQPAA